MDKLRMISVLTERQEGKQTKRPLLFEPGCTVIRFQLSRDPSCQGARSQSLFLEMLGHHDPPWYRWRWLCFSLCREVQGRLNGPTRWRWGSKGT